MLLTGTFHRSLDEKSRFALPKRLRDTLLKLGESGLYLAPGTDGSLALYPENAFSALGGHLGHHSPTGQEVRTFSRLFYAQAQRVEMDRQGRIRIPPELARLAALEREVVLLGVRDHMEIWEQTRWQTYLEQYQPKYDEIAESAFQPPPPSQVTNYVTGNNAGNEEQAEPLPAPAKPR